VHKILLKYGTIFVEAMKFFGPVIVLNYGTGERKLKIEISNRNFENRYEVKNYLGINMKVMVLPDMFAHKLCALLDRNSIAGRDIFDCWFFMKNHSPLNKSIIESRMNVQLSDYLQKCVDRIEEVNDKSLLQGTGELMDKELKKFVRTRLRSETIGYLKYYKEFPILE